jgi:hypothetical protein
MEADLIHACKPIPDEVNFYNLPNPPGPTRPCGILNLLIEMSTRSSKIIRFMGNKVRRVRKADNLSAIYELIV